MFGDDDTQRGGQLPWYYDEGADPPAGTSGFIDGLSIADVTAGDTLSYFDTPGGAAGTNLSFMTWLVSLMVKRRLSRQGKEATDIQTQRAFELEMIRRKLQGLKSGRTGPTPTDEAA